jgi:Fusaric acid resistance protein-like
MSKYIQFTRDDTLHALLGVVPAFILVALGHITLGIAFAIGLLPTSLMGIAPTRKRRAIYGIVGCLFGVGVFLGSLIATWHSVYLTAAIFFVVCFVATLFASRWAAGGLLLSIVIPSLAVGTGYTRPDAFGLMLAFMLGSVWSSIVMLGWPEFEPDPLVVVRLKALQPEHVRTYGVLLGLTAATAILSGHVAHNPYPGWIATAAMLIMRPVQQMTGWRGVGRAISTIVGTLLVIFTINQALGHVATATVVCVVATLTIGARTSKLYITPFGTAFLILTIELYGVDEAANIYRVGWYRIVNNVVGALIALFFGLLVPWALQRGRGAQESARGAIAS